MVLSAHDMDYMHAVGTQQISIYIWFAAAVQEAALMCSYTVKSLFLGSGV